MLHCRVLVRFEQRFPLSFLTNEKPFPTSDTRNQFVKVQIIVVENFRQTHTQKKATVGRYVDVTLSTGYQPHPFTPATWVASFLYLLMSVFHFLSLCLHFVFISFYDSLLFLFRAVLFMLIFCSLPYLCARELFTFIMCRFKPGKKALLFFASLAHLSTTDEEKNLILVLLRKR